MYCPPATATKRSYGQLKHTMFSNAGSVDALTHHPIQLVPQRIWRHIEPCQLQTPFLTQWQIQFQCRSFTKPRTSQQGPTWRSGRNTDFLIQEPQDGTRGGWTFRFQEKNHQKSRSGRCPAAGAFSHGLRSSNLPGPMASQNGWFFSFRKWPRKLEPHISMVPCSSTLAYFLRFRT